MMVSLSDPDVLVGARPYWQAGNSLRQTSYVLRAVSIKLAKTGVYPINDGSRVDLGNAGRAFK
jgi:hypothetical protein